MNKLFYSLLFFILTLFSGVIDSHQLSAQEKSSGVRKHIERFKRDSLALSSAYYESLGQIAAWEEKQASVPASAMPYFSLLDQYLSYIRPGTFRRYALGIHEDIIAGALPILQAAADPSIDMEQFAYSLLPDAFAPVKMLIPASVATKALMAMAKDRPQELIGQYAWLDYTQDDSELIEAIKASPHHYSKFMHYQNHVKKVLLASKDPDLKLMADVYAKYRYSDHPYYLLPLIKNGTLSIEEAENAAKQEHLLLQYISGMLADTTPLARFSISEKWAELSSQYLTRVKQNRFTPVQKWEMKALEQTTDEARLAFLFFNHAVLSPVETEALLRWISLRHFLKPFAPEMLDHIPMKEIMMLEARVEEHQLRLTWEQCFPPAMLKPYLEKRRKTLSPQQLQNLSSGLLANISTPGMSLPKPKEPEFIIQKYYFNLSDDEKALIKWKNDPMKALENISEWLDKPYAGDLLQQIAMQYPLEIVKKLPEIKLKKEGIEALKTVGKYAPLSAKNFIIQPAHPWNFLFKNAQDSVIKTLYRIHEEAGIYTRAYLLLDDIYHNRISIQDADSLCRVPDRLLKALIAIAARPDALGRYSVEQELSAKALQFVRNVNISENTDKYFSDKLYSLSPEELYTFITYGEDELIEKGFRMMFRQLTASIPGGNLYPLMEKLGFNQYRKFLRKGAYYGLDDEVFGVMQPQQKEALAGRLLKSLESASESEAIQVADIIISLDHYAMTDLFHQRIRKEYERCEKAKLDKGVAVYGVLSSLLAQKVERGWAKYVAEKYTLPALDVMPAYELFNQQMANIQQYYFYDDEDGIQSFNNFIRSYQKSPLEWEIKDLGTFVAIHAKSGRRVEIYANKAKDGEKGIEAMLAHMEKNKLEPLVVVHRGLSTHTLKTFSRVPSSARLILDGSCGGYHVQQVAIDRAPGAQILCNRNVGTMHVNDPIFKQISDDIRIGRDIVWPEFWNRMNNRVGSNPYFRDYIPPHKNAAAILLKALYDVLEIN